MKTFQADAKLFALGSFMPFLLFPFVVLSMLFVPWDGTKNASSIAVGILFYVILLSGPLLILASLKMRIGNKKTITVKWFMLVLVIWLEMVFAYNFLTGSRS